MKGRNFFKIPSEVFSTVIFPFLTMNDLSNLSLACQYFYKILTTRHKGVGQFVDVWKVQLKKYFPEISSHPHFEKKVVSFVYKYYKEERNNIVTMGKLNYFALMKFLFKIQKKKDGLSLKYSLLEDKQIMYLDKWNQVSNPSLIVIEKDGVTFKGKLMFGDCHFFAKSGCGEMEGIENGNDIGVLFSLRNEEKRKDLVAYGVFKHVAKETNERLISNFVFEVKRDIAIKRYDENLHYFVRNGFLIVFYKFKYDKSFSSSIKENEIFVFTNKNVKGKLEVIKKFHKEKEKNQKYLFKVLEINERKDVIAFVVYGNWYKHTIYYGFKIVMLADARRFTNYPMDDDIFKENRFGSEKIAFIKLSTYEFLIGLDKNVCIFSTKTREFTCLDRAKQFELFRSYSYSRTRGEVMFTILNSKNHLPVNRIRLLQFDYEKKKKKKWTKQHIEVKKKVENLITFELDNPRFITKSIDTMVFVVKDVGESSFIPFYKLVIYYPSTTSEKFVLMEKKHYKSMKCVVLNSSILLVLTEKGISFFDWVLHDFEKEKEEMAEEIM